MIPVSNDASKFNACFIHWIVCPCTVAWANLPYCPACESVLCGACGHCHGLDLLPSHPECPGDNDDMGHECVAWYQALKAVVTAQHMSEPCFRVTDENRKPMDTALDARIVIPAHIQQQYGLPPAERANVIITAYYDTTPEQTLEAIGIVRLGSSLYRCEQHDREEDWILTERLTRSNSYD